MGLGMEEYSVFHFHEKLDRQTFAENIWICGHATFPELFEFVDRFIGKVLSVFFLFEKPVWWSRPEAKIHFSQQMVKMKNMAKIIPLEEYSKTPKIDWHLANGYSERF